MTKKTTIRRVTVHTPDATPKGAFLDLPRGD